MVVGDPSQVAKRVSDRPIITVLAEDEQVLFEELSGSFDFAVIAVPAEQVVGGACLPP